MPYRNSAKDYNWRKKNIKNMTISFNKHTERELLEWLETKPSKHGFIKDLLTRQMESERS
jgi:hypothetical protein